jgi:hypothetical protein
MKAKNLGAICVVAWTAACSSNREVVGDERASGGSSGTGAVGGASSGASSGGSGTGGSAGTDQTGGSGGARGGSGGEGAGGGTGALGGDAGASDTGGTGASSGEAGEGSGGAASGMGGESGMSGSAGSAGAAGAGGGQGGSGGGPCGGVTCADGLVCCGPPECGYCINPLTGPACAESCPAPNRPCGADGLMCRDSVLGYPGEVCVERIIATGPLQETTYGCVRHPCAPSALDCTCAGTLCEQGTPFTQCTATDPTEQTVTCVGGGPCVSPDTPIATPEGDRPIAELRPGDLVYGARDGALDLVPVLRVSRTPVTNHHVVRVLTRGGAVLEVSELHPTADGRTFAELAVGDALDGDLVVSREVVPYPHGYTYDILPASDGGSYVASGLLIGTTLE